MEFASADRGEQCVCKENKDKPDHPSPADRSGGLWVAEAHFYRPGAGPGEAVGRITNRCPKGQRFVMRA